MGRNANKGKYQASISILDLTKSPYELLLHVCICLCFQSSAINDYARERELVQNYINKLLDENGLKSYCLIMKVIKFN